MNYAGTWMMDGIGRGEYRGGMWSNHMGGFGGDFDMFGPMSLITISILSVLFFLAVIWTVAIKGYALWHAAKRGEKWWFIALLVINTFGILELAYLIFVAKIWAFGGKKKSGIEEKKSSESGERKETHTVESNGN